MVCVHLCSSGAPCGLQGCKNRPIGDVPVLFTTLHLQSTVRNLGVILRQLRGTVQSNHITNVYRSGYYQLRQLHVIIQSLTPDAVRTLLHAFITSRLDYCNSLLLGVTDQQLKRLQSVQNATARLVTGARRFDHITAVLQSLHWLPVRQRICYKIALLVHKCLNGRSPHYLIDECCLADGCQMLQVTRCNTIIRRPFIRCSGCTSLEQFS